MKCTASFLTGSRNCQLSMCSMCFIHTIVHTHFILLMLFIMVLPLLAASCFSCAVVCGFFFSQQFFLSLIVSHKSNVLLFSPQFCCLLAVCVCECVRVNLLLKTLQQNRRRRTADSCFGECKFVISSGPHSFEIYIFTLRMNITKNKSVTKS